MDTLGIECLIQSLTEYVVAKQQLDFSRERAYSNGAHSWEYFSRHEIDAVNKKAEDFGKRLTEFIDQRIAQHEHTQK